MSTTARTDFSAYSHQALVAMLHDGDPEATAATAEAWSSIGAALHDQAGLLERTLRSFDGIWQGEAATAYHAMISDLASGIRQTATTALVIRDLVHHASDALNLARAAMPDFVDVPVPPAPTPPTAAQVEQQQQLLATAVDAHGRAVIVMTDLAHAYAAIDAALPPAPPASVPAIAADGTVRPNATGAAVNPAPSGPVPLFSQVFRAGLAVAGVAAAGRFGTGAVRLTPRAAPATIAATKPSKLFGGNGASLSPVASPALSGSAATADPNGLTGATAAVGSNSAGAAGTGYMPPMGYGMSGAQDGMGTGRRIPPWLVETEDVWGESSAITPGVIGE